MASKRKSTVPCMIPNKTMHLLREELEPSAAHHQQGRASGVGRQSPLGHAEACKPEAGCDTSRDGVGTYTCRPCNFETRDLNLFLDHVYSGHPDFRADPSFLCVDCGDSAPKFEGLALHNARVHPSTMNTSLQLRRRDKRLVVEQHLVTETDVAGRDSEISITKTPIMRMLKGKSESKRIVVSHPVADELCSEPIFASERRETPTVTVTHVPTIVHNGATNKVTLPSAIQIVNGSGALPMLKTAITQVVSVVQNRSLHQSGPITVSSTLPSFSSPSASSKNLPKVMIPLSSIPTYSASMDSSSFLKTSFSKFPYPTKAELCYLTVVTKFPEEQIKIWFTAQRLKQGISWSPEEIEEARRKMFNTIIQTAPPSSHNQRQTQSHQSHQSQAQHTITVLPASLGTSGLPHILQSSLVSQPGVIVTQPVMANGIQVSSAPMALAVTPKPQAAARPMMQARPAAALAADKGIGMVVGTVGSSSSGINVISSCNSSSRSGRGSASSIISVSSSQASVINLSLENSIHSNSNGKIGGGNGKLSSANADRHAESISDAIASDANKNVKVSRANDTSSTVKGGGGDDDDDKCAADVKSATESQPSAVGAKNPGNGQKSKDSNSGGDDTATVGSSAARVSTTAQPSSPAPTGDVPSLIRETSSPSPHSSGTPGSRSAPNALLDASSYKGKKSQEQLNTLKDSFQVNQFPNQEEVDRLIAMTGLTVREVRKWFSDRRYHFRNLKGARSSTGGQTKSPGQAAADTSSAAPASATTPPASSSAPTSGATPMDLSESGSGAKTPQQNTAPLSPPPSRTPTSPTTPSRRPPRPPSPDFTAIRYKEREPHQVKALEASFAQDPDPPGEEVDRLRTETKMTRREIHGWFAEKRKRAAAERRKEEEEAERVAREAEKIQPKQEESKNAEGVRKDDEEERQKEDGSGELKVNPIKINLKMLKVTEASGKLEGDGSDGTAATPTPSPGPTPSATTPKSSQSHSTKPPSTTKPSPIRGKKSLEQLHLLKQVYARTQWPSAVQYDELIAGTGLPRPEVVRWFGDCRYVQKNSLLKWLDAYQNMALDEDLQKGDGHILQAHLDSHGTLEESQIPELAQSSGLTEDLVRRWFSTKTTSPPQAEDTAADTTGPDTPDPPPELQTGGSESSPPETQLDNAEGDKTVNPSKGTD